MAVAVTLGSAVALGASGAALADSVTPATELGRYRQPTSIAAYGDTAAWSAYDHAGRRFVLTIARNGQAPHALPSVAPRKDEFDVNVGRGPDGRPLVVYTDCPMPSRCGIYGIDSFTGRPLGRLIATRRLPGAPSVWGRRAAWVETVADRAVLKSAALAGKAHVVQRFGSAAWVGQTALLGHTVAYVIGSSSTTTERVQLVRLNGTRLRTIARSNAGEGQQGLAGVSAIGSGFALARTCPGCGGGPDIVARYRNGRWQQAQIAPGGLGGFALASSGAYWSTTGYDDQCEGAASTKEGTCSVRHGELQFRPGRPTWATRGH